MKLRENNNEMIGFLNTVSRKFKTAINKYGLAVFLTISNTGLSLASDFGQQVLNNNVRFASGKQYNINEKGESEVVPYGCNISNILIDGVIFNLTAEHCGQSFTGKFRNGDLKISRSSKQNDTKKYSTLNYDLKLSDSDLIGKTVQVIGKVPFFMNGREKTLDVEFEIEVSGHDLGIPGQLIGIINLKKFYDKIDEYFNKQNIKVIYKGTYLDAHIAITGSKSKILDGLSGAPIFKGNQVIGVLSRTFPLDEGLSLIGLKSNMRVYFTGPNLFKQTVQTIKNGGNYISPIN